MTDDSNISLALPAPDKAYAAKHRKRTAVVTEERIRAEVTTETMALINRDTSMIEAPHQKIEFMVMMQMSALARQCLAHGIVVDL